MLSSRFHDYAFIQNIQRIRENRIALVVALAFGTVRLLVAVPEKRVAMEALFILFFLMCGFTLKYCLGEYHALEVQPPLMTRSSAWRLASAAALLAIWDRLEFSGMAVQAAVTKATDDLNTQAELGKSMKALPVDNKSLPDIARLEPVQRRLRNSLTVGQSRDRQKATRDYAVLSAALAYARISKLVKANAAQAYVGFTIEQFSLGAFKITGDAIVMECVLASIGPLGSAITKDCSDCTIVAVKNTLQQCPQILDGIYWFHNSFINCKIIYNGGPLNIVDSTFSGCTFQTAPSVDPRVAKRIFALDGLVTLTSEFPD